MTTLPTMTNADDHVPVPARVTRGEISAACSRNQHQMHNLLVGCIKASGLTQKALAEMAGIDEASLSRILNRPRNGELDTFSKLVFCSSGATMRFSLAYPKSDFQMILIGAVTDEASTLGEPSKLNQLARAAIFETSSKKYSIVKENEDA